MTEIIAVVSHKGGTGKTSLVQNLAYELAKTGRVLAIDLDPQSNLTVGCGFDPGEERTTVFQALAAPGEATNAIVQAGAFALLPASLDLALAEQQFAGHYDRNDKLRDVVEAVQQHYTYILIDSPPSLGFFAFNALTAATEAIVPLQCQPYAFRALESTLQLIQLVQKGNRALTLRAIVPTLYDRRLSLTRSVENAARQRFGTLVTQAVIPINIAISEATLDGVPVAEYAPTSSGALAYETLAKELFNG